MPFQSARRQRDVSLGRLGPHGEYVLRRQARAPARHVGRIRFSQHAPGVAVEGAEYWDAPSSTFVQAWGYVKDDGKIERYMGRPYTVTDALRDGVVKPIHWQPRVTDWQLHGTKLDLAFKA